eukprot:5114585-Prymnesium_polylepis.1
MMFLGARDSAVSAAWSRGPACMSALCGCMGACVPQALAVCPPRLMVHGATSSEHISHVTTAESRSDSDAV